MTVLTINYRLVDRVRRTEHPNAAEARKELLRFANVMVYDREGNGESGTLFAGRSLNDREVVATYRID